MGKKIIEVCYQKITGVFLPVLACVLIIIIFAEVCCRYLFNFSLIWPEELARYLIIWIVFIGISPGIRENHHVSLEFVVKRLPKEVKKWVIVTRGGAVCFFFIFLTYYGFKYSISGMHRSTLTMGFPIGYVYFVLPIGSILAVITSVEKIFLTLSEGKHGRISPKC